MALLTPPFAHGGDRRVPTATERNLGLPCGPADKALFNDLWHRLEAEIGEVITFAGLTQTDASYTQLREAIQALVLLKIGPPLILDSDSPFLILNKKNLFESGILWQTATKNRWKLFDNTVSETGVADGSNLELARYDNAGTLLGTVLSIVRADGTSTFTGPLRAHGANPSLTFRKDASGGVARIVSVTNTPTPRPTWSMEFGDATAETSTNTGSNFSITRYDNTGAIVDQPMQISRENANVTFQRNVIIEGTTKPAGYGFSELAAMSLRHKGTDGSNVIDSRRDNISLWQICTAYNDAKANFLISCWNDANTLYTPISIERAAGIVGLGRTQMYMQGTVSGTEYTFTHSYSTTQSVVMYVQGQNVIGTLPSLNYVVGTYIWQMTGLGNFSTPVKGYQPGGGSWAATSDARIKNVVGAYDSGLEAILKLRPVRYTYKGNDTDAAPTGVAHGQEFDPAAKKKDEPYLEPAVKNPPKAVVPYPKSPHYNVAKGAKEFVGLIAQEVEGVMPEMVSQRAGFIDGEKLTDIRELDTSALIFALVNSCKELAARVAALEGAKG